MRKRSPARSASGRRLNRSQASLGSSVRQLLHAGINAEDKILSKALRLSQSSVLESGDLHPRFKGNRSSYPLRKKQASISRIRWTCPPKFILNDDWHVAAGDQSEERRVQEQRESGLNLIFPHPSATPSSPSISLDVEEGGHDDDHNIPIIPITPIEDEEADSLHEVTPPSIVKGNVNLEVFDGVQTSHLVQHSSQLDASVAAPKPNGEKHPLGTLTGIEADVGAAASAAFTALIKSNEQGSLIDTDLLVKILNDPKMIELLKVAWSLGNKKVTPQDETEVPICSLSPSNPKQENLYMMQPYLDIQSVLNLVDPAKEGSIMLPTKMQLTSSPPPCSVPDTTFLLKQVCGNQVKLLKQAQKASELTQLSSSAELVAPISDQPLPQKLENPAASSVAMLTRASIIPLQEDPRSRFTASRPPPQPSFFSTVADKSNVQFGRDHSYYKSLVRQHGVERQDKLNTAPKASFPKPCSYFNSPRGCRLGLSCPYRHEFSSTQMRAHRVPEAATATAKRVKLTRKNHLRL